MNSLSCLDTLVETAPLLRRVATAEDLSRPRAIVCFAQEVAAAKAWVARVAGRSPWQVVAADRSQWWLRHRLARSLREGIAPVVYGFKPRLKAKRLAWCGIPTCLFAEDPAFAQTRTDPGYFAHHRPQLERLFACLEDEESCFVLASVLRQRTTGDHGYLRMSKYPEYCHPAVRACPGDHVVDGGAFDGRTSRMFARQVGRRGVVYAFEPSLANRQMIQRSLSRFWNRRLRIVLEPQALSSAVGTARFELGRGSSGRMLAVANKAITEEVPTTTLDHFAADGRRIDLISLDIEGAEPLALAGAHQIISAHRPKLQISVYHRMSHLFEIPLRLLDLYPDYALFLGHHDVYSTETDAYLIPRERL